MPRINIITSTHPDLTINMPYTLIIRKHGFIFKKLEKNKEEIDIDFVFMIKILPDQIKNIENKTDKIENSFLTVDFSIQDKEHNFSFYSSELPISVIYEKIMKIIDPFFEEKSSSTDSEQRALSVLEEEQKSMFTQAIDTFVKTSENMVKRTVEILSQGIDGIQRAFSSVISPKKVNNNSSGIKQIYISDIQKEIQYSEILTFVNKIYINHIDTAYYIDELSNDNVLNKNGKLIVNTNVKTEDEILKRPIMLFIPPFGCDLHIYKNFYSYFGQNYRIIAYDQRGSGGSEQHKNDNYKFSDYIDDLNAFLARKITDDTGDQAITILTSSFTGHMILHNLSRIKFQSNDINLILMSSADKIDEGLQKVIKNLPHPRTWGIIKRTGRNKAKKMLFLQETEDEIKNFILDNLYQIDNRVAFETLKNLTSKTFIQGLTPNMARQISSQKNNARFLLLNAENDIVLQHQFMDNLGKILPNATVKILKGNHFFMFEKPIETITIIEDWLQKK